MQVRLTPQLVPAPAGWLGPVPRNWTQKKLKYVVQACDLRVDGEEAQAPYVGLEHIESWTGKLSVPDDSTSTGIVNRYAPGDVLLGKLRPYLAKVHAAETEGICTTEALVLRSLGELEPRYLFYYLANPPAIDNINSSTYGAKMPRANWDFVGDQIQLVPPVDEQHSIIAFLDRETARIDALIGKKRRLLELLEERRLAVITHAVTKGLDPKAPMKDSGIDWLSDMPAHWQLKKLKFLGTVHDCKHVTPTYTTDGYPLVSTSEIKPFSIRFTELRYVSEDSFLDMTEGARLPRYDDIIYSRNVSVGSAARVTDHPEFCMGQDICLVRPSELRSEFLEYSLNSKAVLGQIDALTVGATFKRINVDRIRNYWIPQPPEDEQDEIVRHGA